ncbi:MAG: hypothetical protein ABSG17_08270 [Spirochaetia bacterium]|jgi:hypothetical protein
MKETGNVCEIEGLPFNERQDIDDEGNAPVIPTDVQALVLDGIGFDHLKVRRVPTPRPGPCSLLARV